ncbi:ComEA family DNA-binding protein [Actinotalea solisilvae]|uniref:ComEA family DNA-binding protein n=1 Tax=Actinotalea solisilvae TaxID=2072922 RepID=UPI0027DACD0D|nr:ComEA family DNA-binding protein [Actinotalea solisilvae]
MATQDVSSAATAHRGADPSATDARRRLRALAAAAQTRPPVPPESQEAAPRGGPAGARATGWVPAREAPTRGGAPRWSPVRAPGIEGTVVESPRDVDGTVVEPAPDGDGGAAGGDGSGLRRRALAAAVTGYTAAHGHPLEHPAAGDGTRGRPRWAVRPGAVAVAVLVLVVVAGLVGWRALRPAPSVVVDRGGAATPAASPSPGADAVGADAPVGADGGDGAVATGTTVATDVTGAGGGSGTAGGAGDVVVHVVGQVVAPGVLALPAGSRVVDALAAAGGPLATADLAALNLARELVDGEQVVVPQPGDPPVPSAGPAGGVVAPDAPLDLNAADLAALDGLPGIGPVLAERILAWRDEHGRFTSVEELAEVPGIGPGLLGDLRDLVRV